MNDFAKMLENDQVVALVMREVLQSVEDAAEPIYPPTFLEPQTAAEKVGWVPYVTDEIGGKRTVLLDTYGSQSNRMEEIFGADRYRDLVPQHAVLVTPENVIPFVAVPHRVADAVLRFSSWHKEVEAALLAWKAGDAEPLARLAPTSLVHGFFDSRGTGQKGQRLVRSSIRAYDIDVLHYRGQYAPPVDYVALGLMDVPPDEAAKKSVAEIGLSHAPVHKEFTRGGVIVHGEIVRSTTINFDALRQLRASTPEMTAKLQQYVLGLALVAATYPQSYNLRQGCLLHRVSIKAKLVEREVTETEVDLDHKEVLAFAQQAAREIGVAPGRVLPFDADALRAELKKSKSERKAGRQQARQGTGKGNGKKDESAGDVSEEA